MRQQQHVTEGHAAALREVTAMAGTWDGLRDAMANSSDPADAARWAAVRERFAQQVRWNGAKRPEKAGSPFVGGIGRAVLKFQT